MPCEKNVKHSHSQTPRGWDHRDCILDKLMLFYSENMLMINKNLWFTFEIISVRCSRPNDGRNLFIYLPNGSGCSIATRKRKQFCLNTIKNDLIFILADLKKKYLLENLTLSLTWKSLTQQYLWFTPSQKVWAIFITEQ